MRKSGSSDLYLKRAVYSLPVRLAKRLTVLVTLDFMSVSSYGSGTRVPPVL